MPDRRSALAEVYKIGPFGAGDGPAAVTVCERLDRNLVQVSGWPESFNAVCQTLQGIFATPMPADGLKAVSNGDRSVFRVGPERLWLTGKAGDPVFGKIDELVPGDQSVVTEISHSRTILRLSGAASPTVLNRGLPINLDDKVFPPGSFAQSVIHHIPVLVHRIDARGGPTFDVYVTREYAVTFWEWLIEAAEPLGGRVSEAQ